MAIKSGRVGVAPDQVDPYGRLQATDYLIELLREKLQTNQAEINALQLAREHILQELQLRPVITEPIIEKPITEEVAEETSEEDVSILKQSGASYVFREFSSNPNGKRIHETIQRQLLL